jgi:miniconductance mechanosensitive channel
MTLLVRQLQPTENGVPLELYFFVNDVRWVNYEGVQSDIFDHILSTIHLFELVIFQNPSGKDFRQLPGSLSS